MTLHLVQTDMPRRVEIAIPNDVWERLKPMETPGYSMADIMVTASRLLLSEMDKAIASESVQMLIDEEGRDE